MADLAMGLNGGRGADKNRSAIDRDNKLRHKAQQDLKTPFLPQVPCVEMYGHIHGFKDYGPKEEKPVVCEVRSNLSLEKIPSSNIKGIEDWMENYPLVGRELQMSELRSYTARARFSYSPVISVWGIAGIGKSALVRTFYYDRMLHSNQFNKYSTQKESIIPLNVHEDVELEELILKCGGLPKMIVSIAALLATQTVRLMDTVHSLNQKFMQLLETTPEYECLKGMFDWMHSYFRTCPDSFKPCYSRDSDEESAVDKAENFFSKLLELSIIQQIPHLVTTAFSDTSMSSCQVNGFIREYIVSRRMEENLVFELGPNCVLTTHRTGRHLIILRDWDRDKIVFESIDFSRLRSLTVFGKWNRSSSLKA
ncbi:hypothetical protein ZWY2020_046615 [Hordeum vulgare]|nr:hypothetical protein ZWY2020_046615 [Hordeum vulgare]